MPYNELKLLAAGFGLGWIACSSLAFYALANCGVIYRGTDRTVETDYKFVS